MYFFVSFAQYLYRRETTPSSELRVESDDVESSAKPLVANHLHRSTVEKMSSESELEEFFVAAEKEEKEDLKRFSEK